MYRYVDRESFARVEGGLGKLWDGNVDVYIVLVDSKNGRGSQDLISIY